MEQTFGKNEKLTGTRAFTTLFESGHSMLVYPIKVVWVPSETDQPYPACVAFSVSRKNFRNAVDRNLLKRRMREAYRLNKTSFYSSLGSRKLNIAFIFIAREILPYKNIEKSIRLALLKICAHQKPVEYRNDDPQAVN